MNYNIILVLLIAITFAATTTNAQMNGEERQARTKPCYIPATVQGNDTVAYALSGGAFKSYGCKPVDPTYWIAGRTGSITITFARPENNPSFRVWGMNVDDTASVSVNGVPYPLTITSASYTSKIVCGTSPGPHGVLFANGLLVGANTASEANYSYQDIRLNTSDVTSIVVNGVSGAGWGFAGASVYRVGAVPINVTQPDEPAGTKQQGK